MSLRAGYFHFGRDHAEPIKALRHELCESDHSNSLVVLPEAFNIGLPYRQEGRPNFATSIFGELQNLAARFRVSFVVGLIVEEHPGPSPPRSAAYLVTGINHKLMGYKLRSDDVADRNYTPCGGQPDSCNPIRWRGLRVGALICADALPAASSTPRFGDRLERVVHDSDWVCVPAHMGTGNFGDGRVGHTATIAPGWADQRLILANSRADGIPSFITDTKGQILAAVCAGAVNKVVTIPIDQ